MSELRDLVTSMTSGGDPLAPVFDRIGDASLVLIGEASHGTHEFYRTRAEITRRLIEDRGFHAVVAEADWPDAYRLNRYVRVQGPDPDASAALQDFRRFPTWMWRNTDVRDFAEWLRDHNTGRAPELRVGFYGMDLYSLHASMEKVLEYLERIDPEAAKRARERYGCFDHYGEEPQHYGYVAGLGLGPTCEEEVVTQLMDLRRKAESYLREDGFVARDEQFFVEQNARLVKNAEEYYRAMFAGRENTWNLRDTHMVETVHALRDHLSSERGERAKLVVWAHNSHLGDARYTDRAKMGEINVGQLLREAHGDDCVLVGFTTHQGTVAAASDWGRPVELKRVRPSLEDSWERTLHDVGLDRFVAVMDDRTSRALAGVKLNRAIGVIYRPQTERWSHYFDSELSKQFDVVIHYDETRAVQPLERPQVWPAEDLPETYPHGL